MADVYLDVAVSSGSGLAFSCHQNPVRVPEIARGGDCVQEKLDCSVV